MSRREVVTSLAAFVGLLLSGGCAPEELPGALYRVTLTGAQDNCNTNMVDYRESFEYRVVTTGAGANIFIGEASFASGTFGECDFVYTSPLFTDDREEGVVRWLVDGEASVAIGGNLCDLGDEWVGTETVKVVDSSDPAVPTGCTYVMDVTGTRVGGDP